MSKPLRALIVEDSEDDTLLLLRELRQDGYDTVFERVETPESMKEALVKRKWDIVISDYVLPRFSGLAALQMLKETGLDLPFIIVSGNIGEDIAVEAMKAGAHDYIMKGSLKRLVHALERELREARVRREQKNDQEALEFSHLLLEIANRHTAMAPLLEEVTRKVKEFTGCAALEIRLLDDEGACRAFTGFPEEFHVPGDPLSLESDRWMCADVIRGANDPELPFYTARGSFYMNGINQNLSRVSETNAGWIHNICRKSGHESMALIPIPAEGRIIGMLHLADPRENLISIREVEILENSALQIGMAIHRIKMEEDLRKALDERKQAEKELKANTVRLERLNQELQQFAFVAAHDLQEPLRKIMTFGDRLRMRYECSLGAEGLDMLERMVRSAKRMSGSLGALLSYSRISRISNPFEPVDLVEIARDAASDLARAIGRAEGNVEIGELSVAEVEPDHMRRLFQNLIQNAIKYRRENEKPVVKIYGRREGGMYRIFVEDNGIGFDERYLDRIFHPFQRLHGKSEYEGIGMGLAICRKIAERHGGAITAKSTPGKGSTFIVTLPLTQTAEAISDTPEEAGARLSGEPPSA